MSNGGMLREILRGEAEIPQTVTNRMVLAGMVELFQEVEKNDGRLKMLEGEKAQYLSWSWLLDKVFQPSLLAGIGALIGVLAAKLL